MKIERDERRFDFHDIGLAIKRAREAAGMTPVSYTHLMPSEKVLDFPVDCNTLTGSVNPVSYTHLDKNRGEVAYSIIDVDTEVSDGVVDDIKDIDGVTRDVYKRQSVIRSFFLISGSPPVNIKK